MLYESAEFSYGAALGCLDGTQALSKKHSAAADKYFTAIKLFCCFGQAIIKRSFI